MSGKPLIASPSWTPEEDDRLRKLALLGWSVPAMAVELKRSTAAVRSHAHKLQIVVSKPRNLALKTKGK